MLIIGCRITGAAAAFELSRYRLSTAMPAQTGLGQRYAVFPTALGDDFQQMLSAGRYDRA